MDVISKERFQTLVDNLSSIKPLLVVGDVGIDKYTSGEVVRISPEAPVPILEVTEEWQTLGLAANISYNLKALGVESILCGVLGEDERANIFETLLEEKNLKTWGLLREQGRNTVFKERIITNTQQIVRIDYESKKDISPEIEKKLISRLKDFKDDHGGIIIEDYGKGCITKGIIKEILAFNKERGIIVAVDPSRTTPAHFYKGVDLFKPNLIESKILVEGLGYKEDKVEKVAAILMDKLELKQICITLGADGMALIDRSVSDNCTIIPTVANNVYDVSGAGDTAISLLVAGMMAGGTLVESAWLGNCGSGVVVGKKGTATVSREELLEFHEKLIKSL